MAVKARLLKTGGAATRDWMCLVLCVEIELSCLERCPASLYIDSQVGVYMSPSRLQVGVLVLRLKSWASCRFVSLLVGRQS